MLIWQVIMVDINVNFMYRNLHQNFFTGAACLLHKAVIILDRTIGLQEYAMSVYIENENR